MARPRGNSENPVSLFPFLSILACVIGTLILMIVGLALSQIESQPEEELLARVEEYKKLERSQEEMDRLLEKMLPQLEKLEQYKAALKKLEELAAELRKKHQQELTKSKNEQVELKNVLDEEEKLREKLARQRKKQEELERTLRELREELERRKMVINAPTVCVLPARRRSGEGPSVPVFVEADAKGLVLDPGGKRERVPAARLKTDPRFQDVVDAVAADPKKVLVLLVRSDAYGVYKAAELFARTNSAMVAKLPIIGKGKLDLSRF